MDAPEKLTIVPCTIKEAKLFIGRHHRHHKPPTGALFAIGLGLGEEMVGVAVVGIPISRMLMDGFTCEVTRLCTLGHKNACSMLYGGAWRAARALGYRRLITYKLPEEGGGSLRASGFKLLGEAGGGSWSRRSRPRVDQHPTQTKFRWEKTV